MARSEGDLTPYAPPMNAEQRVLRSGVYSLASRFQFLRVAFLVF
jgi:hypothetical protein